MAEQEPACGGRPVTGWGSGDPDVNLPALRGWRVEVWVYFQVPHQTLVLRLSPPGEPGGPADPGAAGS